MTTEVKIELTHFAGYPVVVNTKSSDGTLHQHALLHESGDSVRLHVHQNQDVVVGEIKADKA